MWNDNIDINKVLKWLYLEYNCSNIRGTAKYMHNACFYIYQIIQIDLNVHVNAYQ